MDTYRQGNVERFRGFADRYDAYRPAAPPILIDLLAQIAGTKRPRLVVDLGSGTGLSTRVWSGVAEQVVGIEPGADMRRQAESQESGPNVRYVAAFASDTGLPSGSADIVTASQALHWLEPESTFAESARILRPGGVFAAYDYDWPPTFNWQVELAFDRLMERVHALEQESGLAERIRRWNKGEHLQRMQESGHFRYTREVVLHEVEEGDTERLIGFAVSLGSLAGLMAEGYGEEEVGLADFRQEAQGVLGDRPVPWYWSYRVRIGVK